MGAVDCICSLIQKSQNKQTEGTTQFLLKALRNFSRWTNALQCQIQSALRVGAATLPVGITGDPSHCFRSVKEGVGEAAVSPASLYWEKHIWDAHIDFLVASSIRCDNDDLLIEWVGILSNLTIDDLPGGVQWHDLLDDHSSEIVDLFQKILDPYHDDLKLELIIWLGNLCYSKECRQAHEMQVDLRIDFKFDSLFVWFVILILPCSYWIASNNHLIEGVHSVLGRCSDTEMQIQILLTYERLLLYEETRFQVIGGDGEWFDQ